MTLLLPIIVVIAMWWFSTGAVLWLATRSGGHPNLRMLFMTLLGMGGIIGVSVSSFGPPELQNPTMAYVGFLSALAVWAMVEFTFLTGMLTGPRSSPCPDDVSETERFRLAFNTVSHHEYALFGALVSIGLISLPGGHLTAFATFALLWLMRLSAKLTLFSGAPQFSLDMMPRKIAHMQSYFRSDRIGLFFWLSMMVSTFVFLAALMLHTYDLVPKQYSVTAVMLTTLLGLGVLEHWFMVLPIADGALWQWALPVQKSPHVNRKPNHHKNDQRTMLVAAGPNTAQHSRTGATL